MAASGSSRERRLALFVLGLLIFNPPILSIFSNDGYVAGIPVLYAYLFLGWAVFIALLFVSAGWREAVFRRVRDRPSEVDIELDD